jgi:hypothetical protein
MYAFMAMMQNMWGPIPPFQPIQTQENVTLKEIKLGASATAFNGTLSVATSDGINVKNGDVLMQANGTGYVPLQNNVDYNGDGYADRLVTINGKSYYVIALSSSYADMKAKCGAGAYGYTTNFDITGDGKVDGADKAFVRIEDNGTVHFINTVDIPMNPSVALSKEQQAVRDADKTKLPKDITYTDEAGKSQTVRLHGQMYTDPNVVGANPSYYVERLTPLSPPVTGTLKKVGESTATGAKTGFDDIFVATGNIQDGNTLIETGDILLELDQSGSYQNLIDYNGDGVKDYLVTVNGKKYYDISGKDAQTAIAAAKTKYGTDATYVPIFKDINGDGQKEQGFLKIKADGTKSYVMDDSYPVIPPSSMMPADADLYNAVNAANVTFPLKAKILGKDVTILGSKPPASGMVGVASTYYLEYAA